MIVQQSIILYSEVFKWNYNFIKFYLIGPRVRNNRDGGEYPTLYTAAKHTALSYDAISC